LLHRDRISLNDNSIYNILGSKIEKEYVEITPAPPLLFSWVKSRSHMRMMISLSLDVLTNERNAYTLV
jgi:hypothetical protein